LPLDFAAIRSTLDFLLDDWPVVAGAVDRRRV